MALKRNIKKAEFDKLDPKVQEHYTETDTAGEFILDTEGFQDTSKLERSLDRERKKAREATEKLTEVETELEELKGSQTREQKDVATLTKEHEKKLKAVKDEADAKVTKLTAFAEKTLRQTTAENLAKKISTVPALMSKHIAERLSVDMDEDEPRLVVLDANGKPSDKNLAQLEKEFLQNPEFKPILVASRASGGRADPPHDQGNRVLPAHKSDNPDLATMDKGDLKAIIASKVQAQE